jgi:hypothetical protein
MNRCIWHLMCAWVWVVTAGCFQTDKLVLPQAGLAQEASDEAGEEADGDTDTVPDSDTESDTEVADTEDSDLDDSAATALVCTQPDPHIAPPGGCTGGVCECVGCLDDGWCDPYGDDCVCADCAADTYCSGLAGCQLDGVCEPYNEGCQCPDCATHPACP